MKADTTKVLWYNYALKQLIQEVRRRPSWKQIKPWIWAFFWIGVVGLLVAGVGVLILLLLNRSLLYTGQELHFTMLF